MSTAGSPTTDQAAGASPPGPREIKAPKGKIRAGQSAGLPLPPPPPVNPAPIPPTPPTPPTPANAYVVDEPDLFGDRARWDPRVFDLPPASASEFVPAPGVHVSSVSAVRFPVPAVRFGVDEAEWSDEDEEVVPVSEEEIAEYEAAMMAEDDWEAPPPHIIAANAALAAAA
ncbi:MAG: hypothetical protein M1826_005139, partial [Phylliscum demangeonii]